MSDVFYVRHFHTDTNTKATIGISFQYSRSKWDALRKGTELPKFSEIHNPLYMHDPKYKEIDAALKKCRYSCITEKE